MISISAKKTPGAELWISKKLAANTNLKCFAGVETNGPLPETRMDKKGLIEVPLPGKTGRFNVRIFWKENDGHIIADDLKSVLVRDGNVLEIR